MEDGYYKVLPGFKFIGSVSEYDDQDYPDGYELSYTVISIEKILLIKLDFIATDGISGPIRIKIISNPGLVEVEGRQIGRHGKTYGPTDHFRIEDIDFSNYIWFESKDSVHSLEEYVPDFKTFTDLDSDIMQDLF